MSWAISFNRDAPKTVPGSAAKVSGSNSGHQSIGAPLF
jgi:hypothetical protein